MQVDIVKEKTCLRTRFAEVWPTIYFRAEMRIVHMFLGLFYPYGDRDTKKCVQKFLYTFPGTISTIQMRSYFYLSSAVS